MSFFLARRTPESDGPHGEGMSQAGVTPFLTRIGNRVLPESFTVKDTPSMARFGALPVGGAYAVDDEGVMAQDVTLVEGGRLRTLLTTGSPNGVAGGVTLISVIAPSLIFEELDIQRNKEPPQKRPLAPSPIGK